LSQLRTALEDAAVDLGSPGKDNLYGAGRINVYDARLVNNDPGVATVISPNLGEYFADSVTVQASASDPDGDVYQVEFQYNLYTATESDGRWTNIGTDVVPGDGWAVTWTTSEYTSDSVYVRARGYDGFEWGDWDVCDNPFTVDNTPPNKPTVTETVCGTDWTTTSTPQYGWSDPGDTGSSVQYYEGQIDAEEIIEVTSPHQPTLGDGEHSFKLRAVDQLENTGEWSDPVTVKIDTIPPAGSITINGGDASTTSRDVTLTLSSSDGGSGVKDMCLSNDGVDWASWEPFTASKAWQLSEGLGEKTVYVRYRDNLDQEADYSYAITLEEEPPDFTINLGAGWNLVSFPVIPADPSVASVMAGITRTR